MWLRFFPTAATACYLLVEVAVTRPVAGFLTRLKVPMQSGTDVPQYHRLSFNPGIAADATEAVTQNEDLNAAAVPSRMLLQQQRSVFLPLLVSWSTSCNHTTPEDDVSTLFTNAMNELAQQSPNVFVVQTTIKDALHHHDWMWTCDMPALGDNYRLSLRRSFDLVESKQQPQQQQDGLVLTLEGNNLRDSDWQWVCHQVYNQLQGHNSNNNTTTTSAFHRIVSTVELRQILAVHYNRLPACPGLDAASAAWSTLQSLSFEPALLLNRHIVRNQNSNKDAPTLSERDAAMVDLWQTLQTQGYVVIDDFSRHRMLSKSENDRKDRYPIVSLATTSTQQQALSAYLRETTGQGSLVRTDRVHFLSREQAVACDVVTQYDFCMGLAHWFNRNVGNHRPGPTPEHPHDDGMRPMAPATDQAPFTIPHNLQFAEYGPGDFYTAHSDNSLTSERTALGIPIRANFRALTCILYMNDEKWNTATDGGALRLYLNSQDCTVPSEAEPLPHVDIEPWNGRLLIFDSRLVHAVRPNTSAQKQRRALTLWINRPNHSGVRGEVYY